MKFGKLPRDHSRFAPALEDYLRPEAATLEKVANSDDVDRASQVSSWPVYKNDSVGDCTVAAMGHAFAGMSVYAGKPEPLFDDSEILRAYSAVSGYDPVTGANDNGAQMQDVLAYMRSTGMTDTTGKVHKVVAYAAMRNPQDYTLMTQVLKTFGVAYFGFSCPQSALDQFQNGPWLYEPDSPVVGGHAIALHRRKPYGSQVGVFSFSTWGALQWATIPFMRHTVDECWAFISEDWLEANGTTPDGLDLNQLLSDMQQV